MTNSRAISIHHVGIQTNDLDNSLAWYEDFLGCRPTWSLDTFSDLTLRRLPGLRRLTEIVVGDLRVHLFERPGEPALAPGTSMTQFQHVCVEAATVQELTRLRARWLELYDSGAYSFALAEAPTEVVTDADGVQSFYGFDVNGLEYEFAYLAGPRR